MVSDSYCHPNNIKPTAGNSSTHRKWMKQNQEHTAPGTAVAAVGEQGSPESIVAEPNSTASARTETSSPSSEPTHPSMLDLVAIPHGTPSSPSVVAGGSSQAIYTPTDNSPTATEMWGEDGIAERRTDVDRIRLNHYATIGSLGSRKNPQVRQTPRAEDEWLSITPTQHYEFLDRDPPLSQQPDPAAGNAHRSQPGWGAGSSTDGLHRAEDETINQMQPEPVIESQPRDRERSPRRNSGITVSQEWMTEKTTPTPQAPALLTMQYHPQL